MENSGYFNELILIRFGTILAFLREPVDNHGNVFILKKSSKRQTQVKELGVFYLIESLTGMMENLKRQFTTSSFMEFLNQMGSWTNIPRYEALWPKINRVDM